MTVSEKVAYLKGLAEGLGIADESKEGKMFSAIIDTLDEIADAIEGLEENALDIGDELDAISADLADVEEVVFDEYDEDDDDDCCCDCDDDCCCCCDCDEEHMFSVVCPACNEELTLDESILDLGEIDCPNCGEKLEFEFDEDDED